MKGTIGEVKMFAGDFVPKDWMWCDGHIMTVLENEALFSVLGNKYGGDGRTNFALPDMTPENEYWDPKQPRYIICIRGDYPARS